jgi:hypothetical protein
MSACEENPTPPSTVKGPFAPVSNLPNIPVFLCNLHSAQYRTTLGQICPWVSYVPGSAMSLGQLCSWVSYVPGSDTAMSLWQLSTWVSYCMPLGELCPWVSYVPGWAMSLGQLFPWVSYVPGSTMFLNQLCLGSATFLVIYVSGSAMSLGQLCPFPWSVTSLVTTDFKYSSYPLEVWLTIHYSYFLPVVPTRPLQHS